MVDPLLLKALKQTRLDVQQAQAEVEALRQAIGSFETLVNQRLGGLLDELSELELEVEGLTDQVRQIRDQRLYGDHQMGYVEGAPIPERGPARQYIPHQDASSEPPVTASLRSSLPGTPGSQLDPKAELKRLYRRLARTNHPDLAVSDGDRAQRTRQMVQINQSYTAGDLPALRKLSQEQGLEPFAFDFLQPAAPSVDQMPELERLQHRLRELRQQTTRLNNHPTLQLSLEVKLARQRGKDLLGEMARELRRKIERKTAERDYLHSQIAANQSEPKL